MLGLTANMCGRTVVAMGLVQQLIFRTHLWDGSGRKKSPKLLHEMLSVDYSLFAHKIVVFCMQLC